MSSTSINTNTYTAQRNSTPAFMNYTLTRARERCVLGRGELDPAAPGSNPGPMAAAPARGWGAGSPRLCPVQRAGRTPRIPGAMVNFGEVGGVGDTGVPDGGLSPLPSTPSQSSLLSLPYMMQFLSGFISGRGNMSKKVHGNQGWRVSEGQQLSLWGLGEWIVTGCCYGPPSPVISQLFPKYMLPF